MSISERQWVRRWRLRRLRSRSVIAVTAGDCLELLRLLPDNSIDSIVTDPPAGIGFMNKKWDGDKGGRKQWIAWLTERMVECLRVLKPGGHALVWAIPRTSHWTATALEDAGFEVRDRVSHFFGTGFPKSANVSKLIDKRLGVKQTVAGANPNHRAVSGVEYEGVYAGGNTGASQLTEATSDEAKEWQGFGTALKPACEDWWLVRKPVAGTIVDNVLEHGTGALNIDSCRITTYEPLTRKLSANTESASGWKSTNRSPIAGKDGGRWPAHITFDEEAAAVLDEQSGQGTSTKGKPRKGRTGNVGYGMTHTGAEYTDTGGASRFFYVAKAPRSEKDAGLDHLAIRSGAEATGSKEGQKRLDNPRTGAGRGGNVRNTHPTVKNVALMRWLVTLITPPGGTVLDPFTGSGTTGIACAYEGFTFKGFELSPEYVALAKARIRFARENQ